MIASYLYICVFSLVLQVKDAVKPVDISMRNLLYSMLSTESGYKSQKVRL